MVTELKHTLIHPLVSAAAWFMDKRHKPLDAKTLRHYLTISLSRFHNRSQHEPLGLDVAREIDDTLAILNQAGFIDRKPQRFERDSVREQKQALDANEWMSRVPKHAVVTGNTILPGTGRHLDVLDAACAQPESEYASTMDFVYNNLELLLRHVEIRRHDSCAIDRAHTTTTEQAWLEKHDVAILFARTARRHLDYRFLNAAMKLNDWAFTEHQAFIYSLRFARFLRAVAEQEYAVVELLT